MELPPATLHYISIFSFVLSPSSVAINHRTQLPLLFISPLGFAPRFRPSVSLAPTCISMYFTILISCFKSISQPRLKSEIGILRYYVFFPRCRMQHPAFCTVVGSTNIPRGETEGRNDRIVAKIQTPFRPSERAPFPTPRIFATLCPISPLGANSF